MDETDKSILSEIQKLSPVYRDVIYLYYYEGYRKIAMTKYLGRDCAVLTKTEAMSVPSVNTDENPNYVTITTHEYVDVLTGVILYHECKNEAGEIVETIMFTDVKFDEDLNVKTIADAGNKFDGYRELMVVKLQGINTATATQTIGNLQITMEFDKYYVVKGDTLTVKTTVKNVGSEPVTLYAPSITDGIQGSVSLSTYYKGEAYNFGHIVEQVEKQDEIYFSELQPGESFTREDVFDTNKAKEIKLEENVEFSAFIQVMTKIFIFNEENDYTSETVITELNYSPFYQDNIENDTSITK